MSLLIEHLTTGYGRSEVLRDVSLTVEPGHILCLLGPNGAGKSTLLRAVSGTLPIASGRITWAGRDLGKLSARERAQIVATVPQRPALPEHFTVEEVVMMGRTPHLPPFRRESRRDQEVVQKALGSTGTAALAERSTSAISGGELQRVLIARALAQQPQVLLLDEATAHLDLKHQVDILHLVRELASTGLAVIATMHDPNQAAHFGHRLALLRDGRILVEGSAGEVLTPSWLERAYDVRVKIMAHSQLRFPLVVSVEDEA